MEGWGTGVRVGCACLRCRIAPGAQDERVHRGAWALRRGEDGEGYRAEERAPEEINIAIVARIAVQVGIEPQLLVAAHSGQRCFPYARVLLLKEGDDRTQVLRSHRAGEGPWHSARHVEASSENVQRSRGACCET